MSNAIQGYSIFSYGEMITDLRIDPYVRALKAAVKPGSVVLDIGTGTGFFAVLACQLGAKQVYAIEPDDAIIIARQTAIDNHCADKIEFIQGLSTQIDLPEQVDVIISDLRGVIPLYQHHIHAIADARNRLLAPDGILIPQQDTIWATLVSDAKYYQAKFLSPWEDAPYGCGLSANRRFVTNTWHKHRLQPSELAVAPQIWQILDYKTIVAPNAKSTLNWQIDRATTIHGIGVWFDADLYQGIGFSNAPDKPECIYGNAFFPLSAPIDLVPGDRVALTLQANLVGDDYIWSWQTQVTAGDDPTQVKANFQQSNFFGILFSPKTLQQKSDTYIPTLNETAKIDAIALDRLLAGKSLGEIAQELTPQFPHRFATTNKALSYLTALSQKYS
jgi:type I protein arginine methyltransferase